MKNVTPFRLGLIGLSCCIAGIAWVAIWSYFVHQGDPPGWIVDRTTPLAPRLLAALGVLLMICAAAAWAQRKILSRTRS